MDKQCGAMHSSLRQPVLQPEHVCATNALQYTDGQNLSLLTDEAC